MTKIIVQNITAHGSAVDFKDIVSANHAKQWLDSHGIVKANKNTIDEDVTIPAGKSAFTAGTVKVSTGKTVTINGVWGIL
tara:strand:- start:234 stop:473 length:240 start_codon:yes stop_codon:yes gene_type:complete